jgi:Uma2 family endonuclease
MVRQVVDPPETGEERLKMSYEDYQAWWDEGRYGEWVNGEVIVFMAPKRSHQVMAGWFYRVLIEFTESFGLGEVMVAPFEMLIRGGRSSRLPDVLFVSHEHLDRLTDDRLEGAADLVIELISDDSQRRDYQVKLAEYEEVGIPEYLIVNPRPGRKGFDFFRLSPGGKYEAVAPDAEGRYHSTVIPGFWIKAEWLWQDPLPRPRAVLAEIAPDAFGLSRGRNCDDQPQYARRGVL